MGFSRAETIVLGIYSYVRRKYGRIDIVYPLISTCTRYVATHAYGYFDKRVCKKIRGVKNGWKFGSARKDKKNTVRRLKPKLSLKLVDIGNRRGKWLFTHAVFLKSTSPGNNFPTPNEISTGHPPRMFFFYAKLFWEKNAEPVFVRDF